MTTLGEGDDGRLLWYMRHAHGTGPAYQVVTVTAASAEALGRLDERVRGGDLKEWRDQVDSIRHELVGKVLVPVSWSPLTELDLAGVPVQGEREQHLFMEDTAAPSGPLPGLPGQGGQPVHGAAGGERPVRGRGMLEMVATFTPALGSSPRPRGRALAEGDPPGVPAPAVHHGGPA